MKQQSNKVDKMFMAIRYISSNSDRLSQADMTRALDNLCKLANDVEVSFKGLSELQSEVAVLRKETTELTEYNERLEAKGVILETTVDELQTEVATQKLEIASLKHDVERMKTSLKNHNLYHDMSAQEEVEFVDIRGH